MFNFSSSSTIVFLIQSFIPSNHLIFFRFLKIFHYIFLNSIVSLHSTFHLLPPFLFHLNFHINFFLLHFHLSPHSFQVIHDKKVNTLSLSPILFLFWLIFFLLFQPPFFLLMVLFVIAILFLLFIYFHLITRKKKCNSIL